MKPMILRMSTTSCGVVLACMISGAVMTATSRDTSQESTGLSAAEAAEVKERVLALQFFVGLWDETGFDNETSANQVKRVPTERRAFTCEWLQQRIVKCEDERKGLMPLSLYSYNSTPNVRSYTWTVIAPFNGHIETVPLLHQGASWVYEYDVFGGKDRMRVTITSEGQDEFKTVTESLRAEKRVVAESTARRVKR